MWRPPLLSSGQVYLAVAQLAGATLILRQCTWNIASMHQAYSLLLYISRSELFSYERCIFYTVVTALITLERTELKSKVVDAPEILTVIDSIPHLSPFLNALYGCNYRTFFQVHRLLILASLLHFQAHQFKK